MGAFVCDYGRGYCFYVVDDGSLICIEVYADVEMVV